MKNYLLRASGIAALAVLLFTSVAAQETKDKDKDKSNKIGKNDEIVIVKKGDKDAKVVIEVKDGAVTVNGQPLDEYKGDDVIVRRGRNLSGARVYTPSPFSGQAWNYSNDDGEHAYLGVSTEKSDKGARITNVTEQRQNTTGHEWQASLQEAFDFLNYLWQIAGILTSRSCKSLLSTSATFYQWSDVVFDDLGRFQVFFR